MPLAITPTFSPWTRTSDDSYIYQLSLVLATAIVSYINDNYAVGLIRIILIGNCQHEQVSYLVLTISHYEYYIVTHQVHAEEGHFYFHLFVKSVRRGRGNQFLSTLYCGVPHKRAPHKQMRNTANSGAVRVPRTLY